MEGQDHPEQPANVNEDRERIIQLERTVNALVDLVKQNQFHIEQSMKDQGETRKKRSEEKSDTPRNQTSNSKEPSPRDFESDGEEDEEEILYETPKSTKKPHPKIDKRMDNVEQLLRGIMEKFRSQRREKKPDLRLEFLHSTVNGDGSGNGSGKPSVEQRYNGDQRFKPSDLPKWVVFTYTNTS
ncbi:hypothetical protein NE237_021430 [Protea cynaroides]|uniref:Uncharacterized protein n=1 Tax=Protea cynaroides TaxID=273540 RepID=A0A9Q0K4C6_9MAGN|nr:hypothetical protein NE237_021430 [Protea cynaroides]